MAPAQPCHALVPTRTAETLSRRPLALDPSWRRRVLDRPGAYAMPLSVEIEGDDAVAQNAQALLGPGRGVLRLRSVGSGSTRVILDFGVPVGGVVEIGIAHAKGGPLRLAYSEDRRLLTPLGDGSDNPEDFFYHGRTLGTDDDPDGRADVFTASPGAKLLRSPGLRGSQRYIALSLDGPGEVEVRFVRVRQANWAGVYDGHFLSSDEALNRAWYASAYATDLSTVRDLRRNPQARWVMIDGAKRDRTIYGANIRITGLAGAYQGAAYRTIWRDSLNIFACQQYLDGTLPPFSLVDTPCPLAKPGPPNGPPKGFAPPAEGGLARLDTYSAWWVVSLADYLRYTGDTAFVRAMAPTARRILAYFAGKSDASGLWVAGDYDGKLAFDWHPPDRLRGRNTFANEVYYQALRSMAEIETALSDRAAAGRYLQRGEAVRAALLRQAWDSEAGAMLASAGDREAARPEHPADANIGAVLFGVVDGERAEAALGFLRQKLSTPFGTQNTDLPNSPTITQYVSPWLASQEALARAQTGDAVGALNVIRRTWTRMLSYGPGTPWEEMAVDGTPKIPRPGTSLTDGNTVSRVHPWSSAVPALSMYILGVRPGASAASRWTVAPDPADLAWAQGVAPTPAGPLVAAWSRGPTGQDFILTVSAPRTSRVDVGVPLLGCARSVAMDGRVIWRGGPIRGLVRPRLVEGRLVVPGLSGSHTFAWASETTCGTGGAAAGERNREGST